MCTVHTFQRFPARVSHSINTVGVVWSYCPSIVICISKNVICNYRPEKVASKNECVIIQTFRYCKPSTITLTFTVSTINGNLETDSRILYDTETRDGPVTASVLGSSECRNRLLIAWKSSGKKPVVYRSFENLVTEWFEIRLWWTKQRARDHPGIVCCALIIYHITVDSTCAES